MSAINRRPEIWPDRELRARARKMGLDTDQVATAILARAGYSQHAISAQMGGRLMADLSRTLANFWLRRNAGSICLSTAARPKRRPKKATTRART